MIYKLQAVRVPHPATKINARQEVLGRRNKIQKLWAGASYHVMQSDGNSFGGNIVLDSVYMVSRYEGSILVLIYEKQIFSDLYYKDLNSY